MAKKKSNKFVWFSSTLLVLLLIFFTSAGIGIALIGWKQVMIESWKYVVGFSFTAILVYFVTFFTTGKGKKTNP
jgi:hypothetical protein